MKVSFTGLPGSGKSYKLAQVALECLVQNEQIAKKYGKKRTVYSNMKFAKHVHEAFPEPWQIKYWAERHELIGIRQADIIIDEEQAYFDSQEWQMMSSREKRFFQQHRRYGVDIYAASQDFAQVDKSIRRVTQKLYRFTKVLGTRDISSTRPDPKFVFAVSLVHEHDPQTYDEVISKLDGQGELVSALFITKKGTQVFDTTEEIQPSEYAPLRKIKRVCPEDGHVLIKYV